MNHFGRKIPIIIKNRKLFVRYSKHWLNVNLEIVSRGGGWKGLVSFLKGINNCRKGNHVYHTVFFMQSMTSCVCCCYCRERKKDEYS